MKKKPLTLGPLEMELLGLFEDNRELSVRDVQAELRSRNNELAYTTVMTVLGRLYDKNLLNRRKAGRQYIYFQAQETPTTGKSFLNQVSHALFHNQRLKPILSLLEEDESLTEQELLELKKQVELKIQKMKKSEK